jgi:hypothetical protein
LAATIHADFDATLPIDRAFGTGFDLTTFEWTIGLLLGAVVLSALARQLKVP